MVNVNLAPGGAGSLDDLVASTERGVLLSGNRSWSIDQLRLNFQFGCEAAYRIVDGEIVGLYRDPVYTGKTPTFWRSCDAICGPEAWGQWGWAFCGKGDPPQIMFVSHGCAPARFRGVTLL
jgi:TldD protein